MNGEDGLSSLLQKPYITLISQLLSDLFLHQNDVVLSSYNPSPPLLFQPHPRRDPLIPFDEFGFTHRGRLELNVTDISFSAKNPDLSKLGFFLSTRDAWIHVVQQIEDGEISCALESQVIKPVFIFNSSPKDQKFINHLSTVSDADQFTLIFVNCIPQLKVSMNARSVMYNLEGYSGGRDYLSAVKAILPRIYFVLALIYCGLSGAWIYVLYKKRLTVFKKKKNIDEWYSSTKNINTRVVTNQTDIKLQNYIQNLRCNLQMISIEILEKFGQMVEKFGQSLSLK